MDPILRNALKALTQNRVDEAEAQTRAFLLGDFARDLSDIVAANPMDEPPAWD